MWFMNAIKRVLYHMCAPFRWWLWCFHYRRSVWIFLPAFMLPILLLFVVIYFQSENALRREDKCNSKGGTQVYDKCIDHPVFIEIQ